MTSTSSLRGQGELLVHLPYQLGFTPANSVVVIGLDERHTIVVTLRLDPPGKSQVEEIAALFGQGRLRNLARAVVVMTASAGSSAGSSAQAVSDGAMVVCAALTRAGVDIDHVLAVDYPAQTWRALKCSCGECPEGGDDLPQRHQIAAVLEAAVRGVAPDFGRESLELQCVATVPEVRTAQFVHLCRHFVEDPAELGLRLLTPIVDLADAVPDDPMLLARATAAIQRVAVRDELLHRLRPDAFPPASSHPDGATGADLAVLTDLPAHLRPTVVARLVRWACRVPAKDAVPIWTCVAALEWSRGGGALATIALDKALAADPEYYLATLVHGCLMVGAMPNPAAIPATPPAA